MLAFVLSLFYIGGIIAAAHAALKSRTAQGAIAWTVSLVSFPFLALPAYLVLGRNKFAGLAEAFRDRQDELNVLVEEFQAQLQPHRIPTSEQPSWHKAVERFIGFELVDGNEVKLLIDGEAAFADMFEGIAKARDYILFEFYMVHDDELGRAMRDALVERAQAGVRVTFLYDEVGSSGLPRAYVQSLRDAGVQVSTFNPTRGWSNRFQLNFRNHRKMLVVDGRLGWVGGLNVGDEYMGRDPAMSPWRDTHLRLEGPVVLQLQITMLVDWYWATRDVLELAWQANSHAANRSMMLVPTGPASQLETASLFYVAALSAARERCWISSPYFVPDEAVMKALELAALRGVDVRILSTAKSDSLPVYLAGSYYIYLLRDLGIRFYLFEPGFLHQKAMLVDDQFASVGTHNFDNRSFRLNFEVSAVAVDKEFAAELEAMFEADFAHAREIDPGSFEQRPLWWRIAAQIARLAAPVL